MKTWKIPSLIEMDSIVLFTIGKSILGEHDDVHSRLHNDIEHELEVLGVMLIRTYILQTSSEQRLAQD